MSKWLHKDLDTEQGLSCVCPYPHSVLSLGCVCLRKEQHVSKVCLDLSAIEMSLRAVQRDFDKLNATLNIPKEPLRDEVIHNLLSGYDYVNFLLAKDVDLLALGSSKYLLHLNCLVLWGACDLGHETCKSEFIATKQRFYDDANLGGVRSLMNYAADHRGKDIWKLAAGAYTHILSAPQLFLEGNHRTGTLIMSQMLARTGRPPFVLTARNAKAYFDPSALVKNCRKRSLHALLETPKLRKRLALLLQETADPGYLTHK